MKARERERENAIIRASKRARKLSGRWRFDRLEWEEPEWASGRAG